MGAGELFSLASAAVWAVSVILFTRSGETMPPFPLNLFKNILGLMVPTVMLFEGLALPTMGAADVAVCAISGIVGIAIADTLYFQALNAMGAGRTGIVSSLFSPSVIVLSYLFLGERLAPIQGVGFALVITGVLLVSWRQNTRDVTPENLRRGVLYGAAAVFLMAVGVVMVKRILETQSFLWVVELRILGGVAGMLLIMVLRQRTRRVLAELRRPHGWGQIVLASVLGAYVSLMLWLAGYKYAPASVASVLNETASIFIVLLAWLMLREPLNRRRISGVITTFSGVVLMIGV